MIDKLYVIALKNNVASENDIFTIKARNKDDALRKYAEDYLIKDETFKFILEDRALNSAYAEYFYKDIYNFNKSNGYSTSLTADEINAKIKENIKLYLCDHQQHTEMFFDFYTDDSKSIDDLDHELLLILALKNIYEELKFYIIKEVNI